MKFKELILFVLNGRQDGSTYGRTNPKQYVLSALFGKSWGHKKVMPVWSQITF